METTVIMVIKIVSTIPKDQMKKELRRYEIESDIALPLDEHLFAILLNFGPQSRNDLVKLTKKPRTTVYDHLIKLILDDKVVRFSKSGKKPGRPKVYFRAILEL